MSVLQYKLQSWPVQREFDPKNMPFRRLGPSGLRVPVFSLGIVTGDPVMVCKLERDSEYSPKLGFYRKLSEQHSMPGLICLTLRKRMLAGNLKKKCEFFSFLLYIQVRYIGTGIYSIYSLILSRGRVIKELGLRRTDLVISTKIFWGPRNGPNDGGLSRKQYAEHNISKKKFHQC